MRYQILRPTQPIDPRFLTLASDVDLRQHLPVAFDCDTEYEAVDLVRKSYPDAVCMPVAVKVGVGSKLLLGVLESVHVHEKQVDPVHNEIPYVLFVEAIPVGSLEAGRHRKRPSEAFDRTIWRAPAIPQNGSVVGAIDGEFRTSELDNPIPVQFTCEVDPTGRVVLHGVVLGRTVAMITNAEKLAALVRAAGESRGHGQGTGG